MAEVRSAVSDDADTLAAIYSHHVRHGVASFDVDPMPANAMREKIDDVLAKDWPFIVSEIDGVAVGYAYATRIRDRPAYAFTVENSIYVSASHTGRGVGRELLAALSYQCERAGFRQMIAVIGGGSAASVGLHHSFAFREVGRLSSVGRKNGLWLDTDYMQRPIGMGDDAPPANEPL